MRIDVILPCLNEAEALPWVLSRMPAGFHPIVADNGSTDASASIAVDHGATVIRGAAARLRRRLPRRAARRDQRHRLLHGRGRLAQPPRPAAGGRPGPAGSADLVLGRRVTRSLGSWPLHARVANKVLAAELRRRTGVRLRDLGPMRCARRATWLLGLGLTDRRFGYPLEMVMAAAVADWRIDEVDIPYLPRSGRSKVTGTVGGTVRTVRDMRRVLAS